MVIFKRGVDTGFPAASGRWETSLSLILFPVVLLVACFTASGMTVQQQSGNAKTADKPPTATQKAGPQKSKPWRVKVIDDAGVPVFSVHAKKSLLGDVAAEIERQLKLPIILTAKAKQQLLTTDFDDVPLESALRLLSVTAVVDYVVTGGADPMAPTEKKPLSVYLIAKDETPPEVGPWIFKDPGTQMLVGMVYETEDEEKAALEVKKRDLQVAYKTGYFAFQDQSRF